MIEWLEYKRLQSEKNKEESTTPSDPGRTSSGPAWQDQLQYMKMFSAQHNKAYKNKGKSVSVPK